MKPLIILIGPTSSGKTALAIAIAKALGCEIISGDSMQFYRHMDIGTAKVTPEEMQGIPHHLIDILEPNEPYTVADFQKDCYRCIAEISNRGKIPFLVGGTGLYVNAVLDGYTFDTAPGGDEAFRVAQEKAAQNQPPDYLYQKLLRVDSPTAVKLHPSDTKRIIRALEVYEKTGRPLSEQAAKQPPPYHSILLGISWERQLLYQRIDQRVEQMLVAGLEEEVRQLLASGYSSKDKPMNGLGYKQMVSYLHGELSKEEAIYQIKRDTRHFAKRQMTWWRRENRVKWLDGQDPNLLAHALELIQNDLPELAAL